MEHDAKTLRIHMKCRDEFECSILDEKYNCIKDYEGYVPDLMPGEHYGDYLILNIDLETGMITNWETPTKESLERFINGDVE